MIDLAICLCVIALFVVVWRLTEPWDIARLLSYVWCPSLLIAHAIVGIPGGMTGAAFLYVCAVIVLNLLAVRVARSLNAPALRGQSIQEEREAAPSIFRMNVFRFVLLGSVVLGTSGVLFMIRRYGFTLCDYFSLDSLSKMSGFFYDNSYVDGFKGVNGVCLSAIFLSPLLGGILAHERRYRFLAFFSFSPALLLMVTLTTKASIVFAITLFLASYLTSARLFRRRFALSIRSVFRFGRAFAVVVVLLFMAFYLRYGKGSAHFRGEGFVQLVVNYGVAHAVCLDSFIAGTIGQSGELKYGRRTFLGVSSVLGLEERVTGVYPDRYNFTGRTGTNQYTSNVYSAFRPLIEDFSILGSLLVVFVAAFTVSLLGARPLQDGCRWRVLWMAVYAAVLQYALYSFVTSPWTYGSILLALALFGVVLFFARRRYYNGASWS